MSDEFTVDFFRAHSGDLKEAVTGACKDYIPNEEFFYETAHICVSNDIATRRDFNGILLKFIPCDGAALYIASSIASSSASSIASSTASSHDVIDPEEAKFALKKFKKLFYLLLDNLKVVESCYESDMKKYEAQKKSIHDEFKEKYNPVHSYALTIKSIYGCYLFIQQCSLYIDFNPEFMWYTYDFCFDSLDGNESILAELYNARSHYKEIVKMGEDRKAELHVVLDKITKLHNMIDSHRKYNLRRPEVHKVYYEEQKVVLAPYYEHRDDYKKWFKAVYTNEYKKAKNRLKDAASALLTVDTTEVAKHLEFIIREEIFAVSRLI